MVAAALLVTLDRTDPDSSTKTLTATATTMSTTTRMGEPSFNKYDLSQSCRDREDNNFEVDEGGMDNPFEGGNTCQLKRRSRSTRSRAESTT